MISIEQTWRWFGPDDPVTLSDIRQVGATGIVTALHHIPNGNVWSQTEISERQDMIRQAHLEWSVVESLPVTEDIILCTDRAREHLENYCLSMRNLAACGIRTITYNFMPVLDWTRTDLSSRMHDGSFGLRFDMAQLALFDIHVLKRPGAQADFTDSVVRKAGRLYEEMSEVGISKLIGNIIAGLPGAEEHFTLEDFGKHLERYRGADHAVIRQNLKSFLEAVIPVAEECGINMAIHPDDPPMNILGIPRIASTEEDFAWITSAVPSERNGICFCTGSLGAKAENDVVGMAEKYANLIHFLHLRNVTRESDGSFYEADHLGGDVDIYGVLKAVLSTKQDRRTIPMRPDHGHVMLDDVNKVTNPGYSAIGRMRGLAELRGVIHAIERNLSFLKTAGY